MGMAKDGLNKLKHKPWWDFPNPMKVCLTKKHALKGHPELPSDFQVLDSLKGQTAFKQEYLKKHYD